MYNQISKNRYSVQIGDLFIAKTNTNIVCLQVIEVCDSLNICVKEVYPSISEIKERDEFTKLLRFDNSRKMLLPLKKSKYIKSNKKGEKKMSMLKGIYIPAIKYDNNNYAFLYDGTFIQTDKSY